MKEWLIDRILQIEYRFTASTFVKEKWNDEQSIKCNKRRKELRLFPQWRLMRILESNIANIRSVL